VKNDIYQNKYFKITHKAVQYLIKIFSRMYLKVR